MKLATVIFIVFASCVILTMADEEYSSLNDNLEEVDEEADAAAAQKRDGMTNDDVDEFGFNEEDYVDSAPYERAGNAAAAFEGADEDDADLADDEDLADYYKKAEDEVADDEEPEGGKKAAASMTASTILFITAIFLAFQ